MLKPGSIAELTLNEKPVGEVLVQGKSDAWSFGRFTPAAGFSQFAPIFGAWSLLLHADGEVERLSEAASDELRRAEVAIDSLKACLVERGTRRCHHLGAVNIDGALIEWKEF